MRATRTLPRHWALGALALGLILAANGCAPKPDDTQGPLAIVGTYTDAYGTNHVITQTTWTQTYCTSISSCVPQTDTYTIAFYSDPSEFLVAQNGPNNAFNLNLWSRFDWVTSQGHLYYCQTAFDAATEADALETARSDDSNPAIGGCGGAFAWTPLN
jgi:hypothetical protein